MRRPKAWRGGSKSAAELRPRHRAKNESDKTPLNFHVEYLVWHLFSYVALILIMYILIGVLILS